MRPDHRKGMKADLPKDLKMDLQKEKGRESPKDISYGLLKTNVSTLFPISIWTATLPELSGEKVPFNLFVLSNLSQIITRSRICAHLGN